MIIGAQVVDQKYLYEDFDRHGNRRLYFRRRGQPKVRLHEPQGSPEFYEEFAAAVAGRPYGEAKLARPAPPRIIKESLRWLIEEYYRKCDEFQAYDEETKKARRNVLTNLCAEPEVEGSDAQVGDLPCAMPEAAIKTLRDRKAVTARDAANARVKAIRQVYKWAAAQKPPLIERNTANDVPLLKPKNSDGHHTWTIEEIEKFKVRHPIGTKPHMALMLFLLLGQRISDVSKLGKQHIRKAEHVSAELRAVHPGRWLAFRQHKNRNKNPVDLIIPILPELETALAEGPAGVLTFLESGHKKPYSTKGLGNWWADQCILAEVPGRAHGLRKAGATFAAENGATPHQLMAIFGWRKIEQAEVYTKKVRQQRIAGAAMSMITYGQTVNECDPPADKVPNSGSISA